MRFSAYGGPGAPADRELVQANVEDGRAGDTRTTGEAKFLVRVQVYASTSLALIEVGRKARVFAHLAFRVNVIGALGGRFTLHYQVAFQSASVISRDS